MAIDRKKVIDDMSKIKLTAGANGLIESCNVFVTQLPAQFWNTFAERLTAKVHPDMLEPTEYLLYNAAHECGYHTGRGIITSEEWKAVVCPMVETTEDVLHGAFAVLTAWGWGNTEIIDLVPGEKLLARAYDYYESDVVFYGASTKLSAYMLSGVCAAFMDLAYGGEYDETGKTGLCTFECRQLKGIECGDDYGEFLVEKAVNA